MIQSKGYSSVVARTAVSARVNAERSGHRIWNPFERGERLVHGSAWCLLGSGASGLMTRLSETETQPQLASAGSPGPGGKVEVGGLPAGEKLPFAIAIC